MATKSAKLCKECGKRPARAAVLNMQYKSAHRFVYRKGHDLCRQCWKALRDKLRTEAPHEAPAQPGLGDIARELFAAADAAGSPDTTTTDPTGAPPTPASKTATGK